MVEVIGSIPSHESLKDRFLLLDTWPL